MLMEGCNKDVCYERLTWGSLVSSLGDLNMPCTMRILYLKHSNDIWEPFKPDMVGNGRAHKCLCCTYGMHYGRMGTGWANSSFAFCRDGTLGTLTTSIKIEQSVHYMARKGIIFGNSWACITEFGLLVIKAAHLGLGTSTCKIDMRLPEGQRKSLYWAHLVRPPAKEWNSTGKGSVILTCSGPRQWDKKDNIHLDWLAKTLALGMIKRKFYLGYWEFLCMDLNRIGSPDHAKCMGLKRWNWKIVVSNLASKIKSHSDKTRDSTNRKGMHKGNGDGDQKSTPNGYGNPLSLNFNASDIDAMDDNVSSWESLYLMVSVRKFWSKESQMGVVETSLIPMLWGMDTDIDMQVNFFEEYNPMVECLAKWLGSHKLTDHEAWRKLPCSTSQPDIWLDVERGACQLEEATHRKKKKRRKVKGKNPFQNLFNPKISKENSTLAKSVKGEERRKIKVMRSKNRKLGKSLEVMNIEFSQNFIPVKVVAPPLGFGEFKAGTSGKKDTKGNIAPKTIKNIKIAGLAKEIVAKEANLEEIASRINETSENSALINSIIEKQ
ncbi:hypothetical protein L1987_73044 [Smallanthus sonchifolius]|uniref:Uncharacterized protein n=1 Tax=Smallanthus sonchifolius TaxID=185202 RepID=A0ACB9AW19_9ASTR|nr:hypothetical protein L1987_73044 [Smallanthus sonchifolius]